MRATEELRKIRDEVFAFTKSPLHEARKAARAFPVLGEGSHEAEIMFIGEAPGKKEAATGRPFCGAAGRVLDELLESAGIDRTDVYVTNVVKDRPPDNRDPTPLEISLYAPFLDRQIAVIQPGVLSTLGRFSMRYVMERYGLADKLDSISRIHGKVFEADMEYGPAFVVPLYHPALALYHRELLPVLRRDVRTLLRLVS